MIITISDVSRYLDGDNVDNYHYRWCYCCHDSDGIDDITIVKLVIILMVKIWMIITIRGISRYLDSDKIDDYHS